MSQSNICFISYYGPKESLGFAQDSLNSKGFQVFDFPLLQNMNENPTLYYDTLIQYIISNNIHYVLWWFINIPTNIFKYIKDTTKIKYIFFNWDEPYNWGTCDIPNKMSYIDHAFVTCQETLEVYRNNGCASAHCLYAGFDPSTNYLIKDIDFYDYNNYVCDISFCCTNLYENDTVYPNQYINRKKLIDSIYNNQKTHGYAFAIYGPKSLQGLYPESYKGFSNYYNLNKIFNYSKINLCTHVLCDKYGYLNERVILIGGSGGLLLVDNVKGIDEIYPNDNIIILNKTNYIEQIVDILNNYDKYVDFRLKFNNHCHKFYTYDKWAGTIASIVNADKIHNTLST